MSGTASPADRRTEPADAAAPVSLGSVRRKLLALVLLPLAGALPLLGVLLLVWLNVAFDQLLVTKVRADLAVAHGYFERVRGEIDASAAAVAGSHALQLALAEPGDARLVALLRQAQASEHLDFINYRRADGALRATDSGPAHPAGPATDSITDAATAPDWRAAEAAPGHGSIEVLQPAQLAALAPQLTAQVAVPLVDTADGLRVNPLDGTPPGSAHPAPRLETRAMVLLASRAVRDESGRLIGHVQAGVLLNRNLTFIDQINAIVYPEGSLPFGSRGTATLFLDDVRISTNVRLFGPEPDQRAIGTRVSAAVRERVLGRGQTWLDRAYVVSDWYVSAYQPLLGGAGQRIGMLYVGYLEAPFTRLKYGVLGGIGLVFFAVMGIATALSLRWARAIFRPVEQMEATMRQIEAGVPGARVGAVGSDDEIGRLARHLDRLLDGLDEQTRALQRGNAELDAKVAQRTRELATAQTQLLRSEKLAAVGQLTASVAHEINNPIAVMQGNLDLLRSQLPSATAALVRTELRLLDAQIERMRLIVMQLLQFARPGEYAGYVVPVALGPLIDDSLELTAHLRTPAITLQRDLQATREPAINRNELQQVLVNLLVNAIDAMPDGGTLTLRTRDVDADRVALSVIDSGSGLDAALMDQLFQPFVTRKKDGTGLGLWISRSLVERHGGDLQGANRRDGRGAAFTLLLRVEA